MMKSLYILFVLFAVSTSSAFAGLRPVPTGEGRLGGVVYVPEELPSGKPPLIVALHEEGAVERSWLSALTPLADEAGYVLFLPRARGLRFTAEDLEPLVAAVEQVREKLGAGPVHLLGANDSGLRAILFAFSRPKVFRTVVALGTDVPRVRPARGASSLRLLVLKGEEDRPATGRASVLAVREHLELAEFRELPGTGIALDPASRAYVAHFLDAASGRTVAGRDKSLPWRDPARGLAERARRKVPALIYLFDEAPDYRSRTERIQNKILFDPRVRAATEKIVPILASRAKAEDVVPDARLLPGPALVVLDEEGKVLGVLQRKVSVNALAMLLRGH